MIKISKLYSLFFVVLFSEAAFSQDTDYYYDRQTNEFSSPVPLYDESSEFRTYNQNEYDGGYPYGPEESFDTRSNEQNFEPLPPKIIKEPSDLGNR